MNRSSNLADHAGTFAVLLCLVFLLPWPHGGELTWEYLPFAASILAALAWLLLKANDSPAALARLSTIRFPLILLACWIAYQFLQAFPLPPKLMRFLSPNAVEVKSILPAFAAPATGTGTLSIAPGLTLLEALKNASYVAFFIVGVLLLNSEARILAAARVMFATSFVMALYSLINHYTDGAISIFASIPPFTIGWNASAHGSFSYQNHYAAFLMLTIPLGFGLMYHAGSERHERQHGNRGLHMVKVLMSVRMLYFIGAVLMLLTLVKTGSRGGNIVFIASIIITSACLAGLNRDRKSALRSLYLAILILFLIPMVAVTGVGDRLVSRYMNGGFTPDARASYHVTALAVISDYTLTGSGAGTYPAVQHMYKASVADRTAMARHAHNDYLELLSDQGLIGAVLLGIAATALMRMVLLQLRNKDSSLYGLQVACCCSLMALLIHSFAEFNFHLPANAVYFFLLLALGVSMTLEPTQQAASMYGR